MQKVKQITVRSTAIILALILAFAPIITLDTVATAAYTEEIPLVIGDTGASETSATSDTTGAQESPAALVIPVPESEQGTAASVSPDDTGSPKGPAADPPAEDAIRNIETGIIDDETKENLSDDSSENPEKQDEDDIETETDDDNDSESDDDDDDDEKEVPIVEIFWDINIVQGENGTITADVDIAKAGTRVTLTAAPEESCGLAVGSIIVTTDSQGAPRVVRGSGTQDDPFWFNMPDDSVTITSEFVRYRSLIVTEGIEHGKIVFSAENNMAIKNEIITITLVPDEGYRQSFNSTLNNANKSLVFTDLKGGTVKYNERVWGSGIWEYNPDGTYTWPIYDDARLDGDQTRDLNIAADTYYLKMPDCDVIFNVEFAKKFNIKVVAENGTLGFVERGRTVASVGERVSWVIAAPDPGYQLVPNSITVTNDKTGEQLAYNSSYSEFMMPESDVTVRAEFELIPPPPVLEVQPFTAVASDTEIVFTWRIHATYSSYFVNYRPKDSEEAFISRNFYAGGYQVDATYTATLSGLENGVEYEIYLSCGNAITPMIYATPVAIMPTSVTIFNRALTMPVGRDANMYATVEPLDTKSGKLIWSSSDETVATVNPNSGKIRAVSVGTATITAMTVIDNAITDTCALTVVETVDNYGGSVAIGSLSDVLYDNEGVTVEVPFTLIVPINQPIFKANFDFAIAAASGSITDVSIDGISLKEVNALNVNNAVTIGGSKINIGALPKTSGSSSQWGVIQPADGYKFLEPGKVFNFVLTVNVLGSAPPVVTINYSNVGNYRYSFYYYDYDGNPTGSAFTPSEDARTGSINLMWNSDEIPTSGTGTALTYNISNANDLIWYAGELAKGSDKVIVNQETGATARITLFEDIDFTDTDFAGIGTEEHPFNAFLLGQNHTIKYNRTVTDGGAAGFINYMSGGYVNGVTTEGSITVTEGDVCVGGLVGKLSGSGFVSSNCANYVDINVTGDAGGYVGGFIGYATTTSTNNVISNGRNYGTIIATGSGVIAVGGHVGAYVSSNGNIGGDSGGNWGDVTGRGYVGGIVGLAQYDEAMNGKGIWENKNYGEVTGLSGEATGGIAGKVIHAHIGGSYDGATSYANKNYGNVTGNTKYTGGIAGYADNHVSEWITYNYNGGDVTGELDDASYVGGVIAFLTGSETVRFSNNINKGAISFKGKETVTGGVVAAVENELTPTFCTGNYYVEAEGLSDAIGAQSAPENFLSEQGWSPKYTDKGMGEDGSPEKPYLLADANDFLWFTNQVNDKSGGLPSTSPGKDYCVKMTADIDLTEYPAYQGIGTVHGSYPLQIWSGTFDGDGYCITVALDGNAPGTVSGDTAIFRNINNATIKNVTVKGSVKSRITGGSAAGLALMCDGTVFENVTNYADVTAFGNAAGIANGRPKSLYEVYNYGKIIGADAAGLTNNMYGGNGAFIRNCTNYGDIYGVARAAGIASVISGGEKSTDRLPSCFIENVTNKGRVTQTGAAVKDAVAWYNASDWTSNHFAAGIIGKIEGVIIDIKNVTNDGAISGSGNNVGGIIGVINHTGGGGAGDNYTDTDVRISGAVNNGNVTGTYNGDDPLWVEQISVGGIVGNTAGNFGNSGLGMNGYHPGQTENLVIKDSVNNGNVTGPVGANVGGIAGLTSNTESGKVNLDNNFNSGKVEGGDGKWADQSNDGISFDSDTHEIIDRKIVEKGSKDDDNDDDDDDDDDDNDDDDEKPVTPISPDNTDDTYYQQEPSAPAARENPRSTETEIPDTQTPAQDNPLAPPPPSAAENNIPNPPDPVQPESNNIQPVQYRPITRNPVEIEPIVLQLEDSKPPLASEPSQNEGTAQDESTPPEDAPPPQEETIQDPQVPLMSEVIIDPTGINPAYIIIPLIAVIVIVAAIGFIRFRRKTSAG